MAAGLERLGITLVEGVKHLLPLSVCRVLLLPWLVRVLLGLQGGGGGGAGCLFLMLQGGGGGGAGSLFLMLQALAAAACLICCSLREAPGGICTCLLLSSFNYECLMKSARCCLSSLFIVRSFRSLAVVKVF